MIRGERVNPILARPKTALSKLKTVSQKLSIVLQLHSNRKHSLLDALRSGYLDIDDVKI